LRGVREVLVQIPAAQSNYSKTYRQQMGRDGRFGIQLESTLAGLWTPCLGVHRGSARARAGWNNTLAFIRKRRTAGADTNLLWKRPRRRQVLTLRRGLSHRDPGHKDLCRNGTVQNGYGSPVVLKRSGSAVDERAGSATGVPGRASELRDDYGKQAHGSAKTLCAIARTSIRAGRRHRGPRCVNGPISMAELGCRSWRRPA
jgi:hypothetical protein